jgi:hypothetical protein
MTAQVAPDALRELQRAIAFAAVDRMLADSNRVPEINCMNNNEKLRPDQIGTPLPTSPTTASGPEGVACAGSGRTTGEVE